MFDVGFMEVVLIFVIGLLVLGPERLPKVASQVGRWVGRARRTATQLRQQLEREIALNEIAESQRRRKPPSRPGAAPAPDPDQPASTSSAAADGLAPDRNQASSTSSAAPESGVPASESTPANGPGPGAAASVEGAPAAAGRTDDSSAPG